MEIQKLRFTNRKSGGERRRILYVYVCPYFIKEGKGRSWESESAVHRQHWLKIPQLKNLITVCSKVGSAVGECL
jgi:hypothetical protein